MKEADEIYRDVRIRKESKNIYKSALILAIKLREKAEIEYIEGKLNLMDENLLDALKHFENATNYNPDHLNAWHYKGLVFDRLNFQNRAIYCYEYVLKKDSNFAWALNNLGVVYANLNQHAKAAKCYDEVIKKDLTPLLTTTAYYNKGHDFYDWADYSGEDKYYYEALKWFDKALEKDPKYYFAYNRKGLAYHKLGEYSSAIENYNKALQIKPDYQVAIDNKRLTEQILNFDAEIEAIKKDEKIKDEEERKEKIITHKVEIGIKKRLIDKLKPIYETKKGNEKKFKELLKPRDSPLRENFLMVLRRWNSFTPAMITEPELYRGIKLDFESYLKMESNLGGGYFLYWNGKGIVIDPGFDFLDNFFYNNLKVYDIDAVVITHAHIDHSIDFEPIFTLVYEYNQNLQDEIDQLKEYLGENGDTDIEKEILKKEGQQKKIDLFMNLGVLKKTLGWIPVHDDNSLINRVYPLEKDVNYDLKDYNLKITAKAAIHHEILTKNYAVGLIFTLNLENGKKFKIGFTSDTRHDTAIENQYHDMNIIIPHLGSIENDLLEDQPGESNSDHLQFRGIVPVINKSNAQLAIISEFGEELGKHRSTIVDILDEQFFIEEGRTRCLTGDIGLKVKIPELQIRCDCCTKKLKIDMYVDYKDIIEGFNLDPYNKCENGILYFCDTCSGRYDKKIEKKPYVL